MEKKCRCSWPGDIPVYVDYHDNELSLIHI